MKKLTLVIFVIGVSCVIQACNSFPSQTEEAKEGRITGQVIDKNTQIPMADLRIELRSPKQKRPSFFPSMPPPIADAETDIEGRFKMEFVTNHCELYLVIYGKDRIALIYNDLDFETENLIIYPEDTDRPDIRIF